MSTESSKQLIDQKRTAQSIYVSLSGKDLTDDDIEYLLFAAPVNHIEHLWIGKLFPNKQGINALPTQLK